MKETIADIIIAFNDIERELKIIITDYISGENVWFVENCLLNNLIINFNSKCALIRIIAKEENFNLKKFNKSVKKISVIRNAVAHSDKLNNLDIIDADSDDGELFFPVYGIKPKIEIINDSDVQESFLNDKIEHFYKHIEICSKELSELKQKIHESNFKK
jgi:hypothetical protein